MKKIGDQYFFLLPIISYFRVVFLITKLQSGFRAERSTNDNLVRLETFIRDAFIKREHVVAVFFDLEKAYDTTWRYGILKDLHNFGMKGRLPNVIKSFLEDRTIQVRVGSTLSDLYDQEQGVPQGAILSTTLLCPQLQRSWRGILLLGCSSVRPSVRPSVRHAF